jgi:hypothetical protein
MAFVAVTTGLIYAVDETYAEIADLMNGPDVIELHVNGEPMSFRNPNIIASSDNPNAMQPYFLPPMGHEALGAEESG